jgi:hypothetical protein
MTEKIAAALAVIVLTAGAAPALGDPGNGNGNGKAKGHEKQEERESASGEHTAPGQAKKEEAPAAQPESQPAPEPQPQSAPAKPHPAKPAKPAHKPAKPAHKPAKPAKPAPKPHPVAPKPKPAPAAAPKPASEHAKAGKTTICHATGSATNPYVTITISDNALPAHARHQDGRDLIPAPAGGCPQPAAAAEKPGKREAGGIDAAPAEAEAKGEAAPAAAAAPAVETAPAAAPRGEVLGVVASGGTARKLPRLRETLAVQDEGVARRESGAPVAKAAAAQAGELPFTGLEAALVALAGLLLVLIGVLVRNLSGRPAY